MVFLVNIIEVIKGYTNIYFLSNNADRKQLNEIDLLMTYGVMKIM